MIHFVLTVFQTFKKGNHCIWNLCTHLTFGIFQNFENKHYTCRSVVPWLNRNPGTAAHMFILSQKTTSEWKGEGLLSGFFSSSWLLSSCGCVTWTCPTSKRLMVTTVAQCYSLGIGGVSSRRKLLNYLDGVKPINTHFLGFQLKVELQNSILSPKALLYISHFVLLKASWGPKRVILIS